MNAEAFQRWQFNWDDIKPLDLGHLDLGRHLSTPPKLYEPDEAAIAARAKQVATHWAKDSNRAYDKFHTALNEASGNDNIASDLFDLWNKGDTAEFGNVLAKAVSDEIADMADQYARDEFEGVLGNLDERIPW